MQNQNEEEPRIEYFVNWGSEELDFDDAISAPVASTLDVVVEEVTDALVCGDRTPLQPAKVVSLTKNTLEKGDRLIRQSQRKRKIEVMKHYDATDGILNVIYKKNKFFGQHYNKEGKARWSEYKRDELDHITISYLGGELQSIVDVAKERENKVIPAPVGAPEPQTPGKIGQEGFCARDVLAYYFGEEKTKGIPAWTSLSSAVRILGGRQHVKITTHLGKTLLNNFTNFLQVVTTGNYVIECELFNTAKHCFTLTVKENKVVAYDPSTGQRHLIQNDFSEIDCKYISKGYYIIQ
jgi:hypothetical protein